VIRRLPARNLRDNAGKEMPMKSAKKRVRRARPTVITKAPPRVPGREPGKRKRRGPMDPPRRGQPR
jgi:hypothetical protein